MNLKKKETTKTGHKINETARILIQNNWKHVISWNKPSGIHVSLNHQFLAYPCSNRNFVSALLNSHSMIQNK